MWRARCAVLPQLRPRSVSGLEGGGPWSRTFVGLRGRTRDIREVLAVFTPAWRGPAARRFQILLLLCCRGGEPTNLTVARGLLLRATFRHEGECLAPSVPKDKKKKTM